MSRTAHLMLGAALVAALALAAFGAAATAAPAQASVAQRDAGGITLSVAQIRINQRIAQAALRRVIAAEARLDGRPVPRARTDGEGARITLSVRQLRITQGISAEAVRRINALAARLDGRPPPRAARRVAGRVTLSVRQLRINQRISAAAVRRVNAIERRLDARGGRPVAPTLGSPAPGAPARLVLPPLDPSVPAPPSSPGAGLGNAAVEVYQVDVTGFTFRHTGFTEFPAQSGAEIERFAQRGYLVRLVTPFPGLNGPADNEIGLFVGSLLGTGIRAGVMQFATNTLFFSVANPSTTPSLFERLPYPFDIGGVNLQGDLLSGFTNPQFTQQVQASLAGQTPSYFVSRTALSDTIKNLDTGQVDARFLEGGARVEGLYEVHGGHRLSAGLAPPGEIGRFGVRAEFSGMRVSAPGGTPIFLPPPLPSHPRPPGCRTELKLSPGIDDGILRHEIVVVCT